METDVKQRLKTLLLKKKSNVNLISKDTKYPQSNLNKQINGETLVSVKTLLVLLDYYKDVSAEWLIRGEGSMLKNGLINNEPKCDCQPTKPRVPYTASAGVLTNALEGVTCEQCEQVPVVSTLPNYDFTIILKGDSMEPKLEGGDEVACKRIDTTSFLQWGKVHVLNTSQGIIIKRIYDDGEKIKCVSYNSEYPPFSIDKNEIYSISLVVGLIRI